MPSPISSRMRRSWSVRFASLPSRALRAAQPLHDARGRGRVEQRGAGGDRADRVDEVVAADVLEHVARGAGHDRVEERLVVGVRREHQAARVGHLGADVAAHLDAAAVGQAHVEHGDVGLRGADPRQRLLDGAGLADDLHVGLEAEQLGDAATDDLVVVEQEDPDRAWSAAHGFDDAVRRRQVCSLGAGRRAAVLVAGHLGELERRQPARGLDHERLAGRVRGERVVVRLARPARRSSSCMPMPRIMSPPPGPRIGVSTRPGQMPLICDVEASRAAARSRGSSPSRPTCSRRRPGSARARRARPSTR